MSWRPILYVITTAYPLPHPRRYTTAPVLIWVNPHLPPRRR